MRLPNNYNFELNDLYLEKYRASQKVGQIIDLIQQEKSKPLVKTASIDHNALITLFTHMLAALNLRVEDSKVQEVIEALSKKDELNKTAKSKKSAERHDDIKIVSKSVRDSHYQIDISKDIVSKGGKRLYMVSCYARDAYLGRYLVKRNFFFTEDRERFADEAYDEIVLKTAAIKDRYYNEVIDVAAISTQIKKILDGVVSEIKMEEDSLATNINRKPPA